jgi:hypothetical protein
VASYITRFESVSLLLCGTLRERVMWLIDIFCKNWNIIFNEKLLIFEDKLCHVWKYFHQVWGPLRKWRLASWIVREKMDCKFLADAGFLCDKALMVAAVLRDLTVRTRCSNYVLWCNLAVVVLCMILPSIIVVVMETFYDCCTLLVIVFINYWQLLMLINGLMIHPMILGLKCGWTDGSTQLDRRM